jgi:hypothetical protein
LQLSAGPGTDPVEAVHAFVMLQCNMNGEAAFSLFLPEFAGSFPAR